MARIRSIKPEFPQSESMGRVSRDARLLFVQLWCICDDHGRTRAASRMLASLLFPYDDDAPSLIDGWVNELVREGCVRVYEHDGGHFLEIPNWLKHQKIDKPSKPQFPAFGESSRILASVSRTFVVGKEGKGEEGKGNELPPSAGEKPPEEPTPPKPPEQPTEPVTPDPIFGVGLAFLLAKGVPERSARSFLGLLRKECGSDLVASGLLTRAEQDDISDPVAWLTKAAKASKSNAAQLSLVPSAPEQIKPSHRPMPSPRRG